MQCDLCKRDNLERLYEPHTGKRGLTVYICQTCGLVQSFPRGKRGDGQQSVSGGAAFGNLRYGKAFRAQPAVRFIQDWVIKPKHVLDVGAGRGDFIKALVDVYHDVEQIIAIEPDLSLFPWDFEAGRPMRIINGRIEKAALQYRYFDLIHCCHTLEHLDSPSAFLLLARQWVKPDGMLFVEVPDLEIIKRDDFVEQFFIDKHQTHFTLNTLRKTLSATGWQVLEADRDGENITVIAEPSLVGVDFTDSEYNISCQMVLHYVYERSDRTSRLAKFSQDINQRMIAGQRVWVWGAGRIFDLMVTHGLQAGGLAGLVDSYLPLDSVHGVKVQRPDALHDVDIVVIAARTDSGEIAKMVNEIDPRIEVMRWNK